jgi:hypothetical protein
MGRTLAVSGGGERMRASRPLECHVRRRIDSDAHLRPPRSHALRVIRTTTSAEPRAAICLRQGSVCLAVTARADPKVSERSFDYLIGAQQEQRRARKA